MKQSTYDPGTHNSDARSLAVVTILFTLVCVMWVLTSAVLAFPNELLSMLESLVQAVSKMAAHGL